MFLLFRKFIEILRREGVWLCNLFLYGLERELGRGEEERGGVRIEGGREEGSKCKKYW